MRGIQDRGTSLYNCMEGISRCGDSLSKWSRDTFRNLRRAIELKKRDLNNLLASDDPDIDANYLSNLDRSINDLKDDEECYWKQRSRAEWLCQGDKNTRYFHQKATQCKAQNVIKGIVDHDG